jgi:Heavy metal binding domain
MTACLGVSRSNLLSHAKRFAVSVVAAWLMACASGELPPRTAQDPASPAAAEGQGALANRYTVAAAPLPAVEVNVDAGAALYACPMHPEVTGDAGATCPKCGMALRPRKSLAQ